MLGLIVLSEDSLSSIYLSIVAPKVVCCITLFDDNPGSRWDPSNLNCSWLHDSRLLVIEFNPAETLLLMSLGQPPPDRFLGESQWYLLEFDVVATSPSNFFWPTLIVIC